MTACYACTATARVSSVSLLDYMEQVLSRNLCMREDHDMTPDFKVLNEGYICLVRIYLHCVCFCTGELSSSSPTSFIRYGVCCHGNL